MIKYTGSGGSRGRWGRSPQGSRFFRFDIKFYWNVAALGVGTPYEVGVPLREILDPSLTGLLSRQVVFRCDVSLLNAQTEVWISCKSIDFIEIFRFYWNRDKSPRGKFTVFNVNLQFSMSICSFQCQSVDFFTKRVLACHQVINNNKQ